MQQHSPIKIAAGFLLLFGCYHFAEYGMMKQNNIPWFFAGQGLFFAAAWLWARWMGFSGWVAWYTNFKKTDRAFLLKGLVAGFLLYGIYFLTAVGMDLEKISATPKTSVFIQQFLLLGSGTFLTSLSEDLYIRAYLYRFLNNRVSAAAFILISSLVYVLNHIYRLQDGPWVWLYLFLIGVFLSMALVRTGSIWMTLGLHWSGNMVYQVTNNIIHTEKGSGRFPELALYIIFLVLLIPVTWYISRPLRPASRSES
jgi:membrane protease YdiL (CAAX protease family)